MRNHVRGIETAHPAKRAFCQRIGRQASSLFMFIFRFFRISVVPDFRMCTPISSHFVSSSSSILHWLLMCCGAGRSRRGGCGGAVCRKLLLFWWSIRLRTSPHRQVPEKCVISKLFCHPEIVFIIFSLRRTVELCHFLAGYFLIFGFHIL